jgi:GNAT superfamily N-acetyltransferase
MRYDVVKTDLKDILDLRSLFLQENNFQIRYNICHERGWTDSYKFIHQNEKIGYGSVKGYDDPGDRDAVFEFYLIPTYRNKAAAVFLELLKFSKAIFIESQSNDLLLTSMLFQHAHNINSNAILFEDDFTSDLRLEAAVFRKRIDDDIIFEHKSEREGDYVVEVNNQVIATGGFLFHYNKPFADLYMEVEKSVRQKGVGSFLIQELKRQCYLSGRIPAARCNVDNVASRATLTKAGLKVVGFMLSGQVSNRN